MKYPTTTELLALIAKSTFRPFNQGDWYSFAGCESAEPMICETDEYIIVIDGNKINMVYLEDEFGGRLYSLEEFDM